MQSSPERKNISYAGVNLSILLINYYFLNVGKKINKTTTFNTKVIWNKEMRMFSLKFKSKLLTLLEVGSFSRQ